MTWWTIWKTPTHSCPYERSLNHTCLFRHHQKFYSPRHPWWVTLGCPHYLLLLMLDHRNKALISWSADFHPYFHVLDPPMHVSSFHFLTTPLFLLHPYHFLLLIWTRRFPICRSVMLVTLPLRLLYLLPIHTWAIIVHIH